MVKHFLRNITYGALGIAAAAQIGYLATRPKKPIEQNTPIVAVQEYKMSPLKSKKPNFIQTSQIDLSDVRLDNYIRDAIAGHVVPNAKINSAYFADTNADGKEEIITFIESKKDTCPGSNFEVYNIDYNLDTRKSLPKFLGKVNSISPPEQVRVIDMTGDGRGDVMFMAAAQTDNGIISYTSICSSNFAETKSYAGGLTISDLDGNRKPEISYGFDTERKEYNGSDFAENTYIKNALTSLRDAIRRASADSSLIERTARSINVNYSSDITALATRPLLSEREFEGLSTHPDLVAAAKKIRYARSSQEIDKVFGTLTPEYRAVLSTAMSGTDLDEVAIRQIARSELSQRYPVIIATALARSFNRELAKYNIEQRERDVIRHQGKDPKRYVMRYDTDGNPTVLNEKSGNTTPNPNVVYTRNGRSVTGTVYNNPVSARSQELSNLQRENISRASHDIKRTANLASQSARSTAVNIIGILNSSKKH